MKINSKQYAKVLYELTKDKSEKEIDSVVLDFSKELRKQRKLKMMDDIMSKFSDIYNKENRIVEVEVISAREIEEGQVKEISSFVKEKYGAKEVILDKKIDEKIKGGIILRIGDEIIDGSISKKIKNLGVLLKK
jgi:F-type H+-transporting ATPase subunit delta